MPFVITAIDTIQLVGGVESNMGLLEIVVDGIRGTICGNGTVNFDMNAADVACKMLNYTWVTEFVENIYRSIMNIFTPKAIFANQDTADGPVI